MHVWIKEEVTEMLKKKVTEKITENFWLKN